MLQNTSEIITPFYQVTLKLEQGTCSFFALSIKGLGSREEIPQGIVSDIGKMFRADPSNICRVGGRIRLLLGQDTGSLLMKPLTHINSKEISKYIPDVAKDLSLQRTPISPMLAVTGSIGIGDSMGQKTSVYSNTIKKEHYTFFNRPQPWMFRHF